MPIPKVDKIWMNGDFVDWDEANIHVLTHTLHYGSGVFEGIRCYNTEKGPAVFRLKEHVDRLFDSANVLNIKIPYTKEEIIKVILETIKINKLTAGYIRPIVYFGYSEIGLNTKNCKIDVAIAVWPWGTYFGEEAVKNGIKTKISSQKRNYGYLNKAKITGNYYNSSIAKVDALNTGYDEAIMLDDKGFVAEGTGENLFMIKNNVLITPAEGSILIGITRDSILQIAKNLGIETKEENITEEQLKDADEVFLVGTAVEVIPIKSIDNKELTIDVSLKLQQVYFDAVNARDEKYSHWLTFV